MTKQKTNIKPINSKEGIKQRDKARDYIYKKAEAEQHKLIPISEVKKMIGQLGSYMDENNIRCVSYDGIEKLNDKLDAWAMEIEDD